MAYVDPYETDAETIANDGRLSRKQANEDARAARAGNDFDTDLFASDKPVIEAGWLSIPGASRSGAISPVTRSQMEKQERDGLIELQRNSSGHLIAFRPIDHESEEGY